MDEKETKKAKAGAKKLGVGAVVIIAVVALLLGCGVGMLAYKNLPLPGSTAVFNGATTISEDQLDTVIGSYTYNGTTYEVTARNAIEESSSVDAAKNDDGTYNVPTADAVLSYARYQIISKEAESRGLSVSDEEMDSYAQDELRTNDYATIASTYSMTEDQVKTMIRQPVLMKKLHDDVVTVEAPTQPEAPEAPSDGNADTTSGDYAQYVINLVGDEWDSEKNTWARTDGDYYASLSSYTISNDSASYGAAQAAYNVAALKYQTDYSEYQKQWTDFTNSLLSKASITVNTMVA